MFAVTPGVWTYRGFIWILRKYTIVMLEVTPGVWKHTEVLFESYENIQ